MNQLYVIMYHYVREVKNSKYPNMKALEVKNFKEQIHFLKSNFNVVTMEGVIYALETKTSLPEKAILLTFDDGYADCYEYVLPILKDAQMQGSFFISSKSICEHELMDTNKIQFVLANGKDEDITKKLFQQLDIQREKGRNIELTNELFFEKYAIANRLDTKETIFVKRMLQNVLPEQIRKEITSNLFQKYVGAEESEFAKTLYLNFEQIKEMKDVGMHIGIHGYGHYWLGKLPFIEMKEDILKALKAMEGIIDKRAWTMSYPFGSYNEDMIEFIKSQGCKLAFLSQVGLSEVSEADRYKILRYDTVDFPPIGTSYLNINTLQPY